MQEPLQRNNQSASPDLQSEFAKREILMELEHRMAELRLVQQECDEKKNQAHKQEMQFAVEWQRIRKQVSAEVVNSLKPDIPQAMDRNGAAAREIGGRGGGFSLQAREGQARGDFEIAGAENQVAPSEQVKNSKPQPVLKPSPALGGAVDRQSHLDAKAADHQQALLSRKEAALNNIGKSFEEEAGQTSDYTRGPETSLSHGEGR